MGDEDTFAPAARGLLQQAGFEEAHKGACARQAYGHLWLIPLEMLHVQAVTFYQ